MKEETLQAGSKVYDSELRHIGEGLILTVEDNLIIVQYDDVDELIDYSWNDAIKYLNVI